MPARAKETRSAKVEPAQRLGERLRRARVEAGLSQAKLGEPHFTRAYVSALELGKIRPSMFALEFLAGRLGKPLAYFVEDEGKERERQRVEVAIARANQLLAQGLGRDALREISDLALEQLPLRQRLAANVVLARALMETGQLGRAAALLSQALTSYEAIGDEEQVARTRAQLGRALMGLGNLQEADAQLQQALAATAKGIVRDPLLRVHVLHNLGVVHYKRTHYETALQHFERALEEGSDVGDLRWLASVHAGIGTARREVGDLEGALTSLRRSESLFDGLHNRIRVAEIKFEAARTLRALGNHGRAREALDSASEAARKAEAEGLAIRIDAYAALTQAQDGHAEAARSRLEGLLASANSLSDPAARSAARFALAMTLVQVDTDRAIALLTDLATELEGRGGIEDLATAYSELSQAFDRQGRSEEALRYSRMAYAILRSSKKGG